MKISRGFTLIELMIVVAIIGVLVGSAFFAYQDSIAKAQSAEGLTLASTAKSAVSIHFSQTGQYPTDNFAAGLAPPTSISGSYVHSVTVVPTGRIDVLFSTNATSRLAGESIFLTATPTSDGLVWTCSASTDRVTATSCR